MAGDHPAYDIDGGIAAGLRTVQIGSHYPASAAATYRFDSVIEAFPVILG